MARSFFVAPLLLLSLAWARDARADDAPAFSELPVGRLSAPPTKSPGRIAAGQKVPGVFLVSQKFPPQVPQSSRYVTIVGDAKVAEAMKASGGLTLSEMPASCLVGLNDVGGPVMGLTGEDGHEWPENPAPEMMAFPGGRGGRAALTAVHSERVVEGTGGGASLEWVDAWVDPATRGAKLIAKGSLPLKLVRSSAFGLKVYAAREERPDGARFVQFVVSRSAKGVDHRLLEPMFAMHQDGSVPPSRCAHIRVRVPADKGSSDSVTVTTSVVLPSLEPDEGGKPAAGVTKPARFDVPPPPPPPPPPPDARKGPRRPIPIPMPMSIPPPPPPATVPGAAGEREVRMRELNVELGVSQTTRDREPVVSVSLGWGGRERARRVPVVVD